MELLSRYIHLKANKPYKREHTSTKLLFCDTWSVHPDHAYGCSATIFH